jgi:hypothetical protein
MSRFSSRADVYEPNIYFERFVSANDLKRDFPFGAVQKLASECAVAFEGFIDHSLCDALGCRLRLELLVILQLEYEQFPQRIADRLYLGATAGIAALTWLELSRLVPALAFAIWHLQSILALGSWF